MLFGAPSGFVYAFAAVAPGCGVLRWAERCSGDRPWGRAHGRGPGIAAAWEGGVSVIAPDGRLVWQRQLSVPARTWAVLADLDGDGQAEVVVNAADEIERCAARPATCSGASARPGWQLRCRPRASSCAAAHRAWCSATNRDASTPWTSADSCPWRQDRVYGPREVPEPIEHYAAVAETGLADLEGSGERQVIVAMRSGETVALSARGERLWRFTSYERKVGISYGGGAYLGFADLDQDGRLDVVLSQQDSYLYVLGAGGALKWMFLARFWYHFPPAIGDLEGTGELNILFSSPEEGGMWALRGGTRGPADRAPWPTARGNLARTNCAPWQ